MQILCQRLCYTKALYRRFQRRQEDGSDSNMEMAMLNQQKTFLSPRRAGSYASEELNILQLASL